MLQTEFAQLQQKLGSSTKITPGVYAVIQKMISNIADVVEPGIKDAHNTDQELLRARNDAIEEVNKQGKITRELLKERASKLRTSIDDHNYYVSMLHDTAKAYEESITTYEVSVLKKTNTCCRKQVAAVPDVEYTPSYATCNYAVNSAAECVKAAHRGMNARIEDKFKTSDKEYESAKQECHDLTHKLKAITYDLNEKKISCSEYSKSAKEQNDIINTDLPALSSEWNNAKSSYTSDYNSEVRKFTRTKGEVQGRATVRKKEWRSTQEIKCMLKNYLKGGGFNGASLKTCKESTTTAHLNAKIPVILKPLTWVLAPFAELKSAAGKGSICEKVENADEAADKSCKIPPQRPKRVCTNPLCATKRGINFRGPWKNEDVRKDRASSTGFNPLYCVYVSSHSLWMRQESVVPSARQSRLVSTLSMLRMVIAG